MSKMPTISINAVLTMMHKHITSDRVNTGNTSLYLSSSSIAAFFRELHKYRSSGVRSGDWGVYSSLPLHSTHLPVKWTFRKSLMLLLELTLFTGIHFINAWQFFPTFVCMKYQWQSLQRKMVQRFLWKTYYSSLLSVID